MEQAVGYAAIDAQPKPRIADSLVLKHDRLFLLLDANGDITPPGNSGLGLFCDDTRILSTYELRVAGGPPARLSSEASRMYAAQVDLAVTDAAFGGDPWTSTNRVHIRREVLLDDRLTECVTITSYMHRPVDYWAELTIGCDFADIFEVRGWRRSARGTFYAPRVERDAVHFAYRGRDGTDITSTIRFDTPPSELMPTAARWRLRLEPQQAVELQWSVGPSHVVRIPPAAPTAPRHAHLDAEYASWCDSCTHWRTDVEEFDSALARATEDLGALYITTPAGRVPTAGIPWYVAPFGRDSIITSLQTLCLAPTIAVDTLRYLAHYQGTRDDAFTEEQPGKIMHELRRGEMARAREIPFIPYYGTADATPLWLILLHEVWRWTGDEAFVRTMLPHAERALDWIDRYGDMDGDGFVEYMRRSPKGLINQGWKDSHDGVPFPDGAMPEPPIAVVEVQGYVHDAKTRMAALYEALGQPDRAARLRTQAESLRAAIEEHFWLESLGTYALALDGRKRPVPTIASNAGHLLWSRVPDAARATRLAERLFAPDMFSGWGVRTLSAAHAVYNPMSYHNGSVWPHDNAVLALGLSLYRHTRHALRIGDALYAAVVAMPDLRLPELYCGLARTGATRPVLYPVSCVPQAWAAGAFFMMLQAVTGILPDASDGTLSIREPLLPPFLHEVVVRGLAIGRSQVSLQYTRHGNRTLVNVLDITGDRLRVRIEL